MSNNAILFDFDGTLADTLSINHQIMNELSKKYKFKQLSQDEVKKLKELPAKEVLAYMGIAKYKVPFVMAAGKFALKKYIDEISLSPQLNTLLEKWSFTYQMGVVSTNSSKNIQRFLTNHQLDYIGFVYADARLSGKARLIKKAIKKQDLLKAKTLYIGDEIRDINAAREAGIAVVAVCWGYNSKEALQAHQPDYLVESVDELERVVAEFFS
ncbi:MAG: HAD-IA family hydrolase [Psychrosphaera sp.]|nr:HAD-IA family hydrolase [Psychrosphaera sp.]